MSRISLELRPLATMVTFALAAGAAAASMSVGTLRCERLENPLGIDATEPRLSWRVESRERNQRQTAYRVLVASSEAKLRADQGDMWDSGKEESDRSIHVRYAGKALVSHGECFWKVRVWDAKGEASDWSTPAKWTMGILDPAEWKAEWIGLDGEDQPEWLRGTSWIWYPVGEPQRAAPPGTNHFRRVLTIPAGRKIKSAIYQYTGDNECRAGSTTAISARGTITER